MEGERADAAPRVADDTHENGGARDVIERLPWPARVQPAPGGDRSPHDRRQPIASKLQPW